MKRLPVALAILAAVVFAGFQTAPREAAVDAYLLENLLPEETAFYASLPNHPAVMEAVKKTKLHQLTQDPEIKAFLGNFSEQLKFVATMADTKLEPLGLTLAGALDLLRTSSFTFAVIDIPEQGKAPKDIVIAVAPRSAKVNFSTVLTKAREAMTAKHAKLSVNKMTFKGKTYEEYAGGGEGGKTIYQTVIDATFVFTATKERMESLIANSLERPRSSLATSAAFAKGREKGAPRGKEVYFLHVNAGRLIETMLARAKGHDAAMAKLTGLTAIRSISFGLTPEGENFKARGFINTGGKKEGIVRLLSPKPAESKNLRYVPENAFFCSAANVDLKGVINEILSLARTAEGERFKGDNDLKELNERLGISLVDDFFGAIGNDVVFFAALPEAGGLFPDLMLIASLNNAAAFEKSLAAIVKQGIEKEIRETAYQGTTIKVAYLAPPDQPEGKHVTIPVAWFIKDNTLFLSLTTDSLKRGIKRMNATGSRSILDSAKFAAMAGRKPSAGAMVYADVETIFNIVANTALPCSGFAQGFADRLPIPIRTETLPLGETIGKYLGQSAVTLSDDADGIAIAADATFPLFTGYAYILLSVLEQ